MSDRKEVVLPGSPFGRGAKHNHGDWCPLIDLTEVFPGNRGTNRKGLYDLYDAPVGVELRIEEADKSQPLLISDKAWEGGGQFGVSSIWQTNGRYHMLYNAHPPKSDAVVCYAISDDGYKWIRPELGQAKFNGSKKNNIVVDGPTGGSFEDPKGLPEERFKAIGEEGFWVDPDNAEILNNDEAEKRFSAQEYEGAAYKGPKVQLRGRLLSWVSSDRIHWKKVKEPVAEFPSDGGGSPHYDPDKDMYFAYIRVHGLPPGETIGIGSGNPEVGIVRRSIGISRTKDFHQWPPPKLVLFPDAQDQLDVSFYGCDYFSYPGRTDLHGMFLEIYHQLTDQVDTQIAFSRDGLSWYRPERKPIVPLGPTDSGEQCMVYPSEGGIIKLPDGSWATAYSGMSLLHNEVAEQWPQPGQIRWARWKPHRFCGIETKNEGRFTIPTIHRTKNELRLNYICAPSGWIKVELIHATPSWVHPDIDGISGFTFEDCDRLTGDSLDQVVTWNGNGDLSSISDVIMGRTYSEEQKAMASEDYIHSPRTYGENTVAIRIKMFQAKVFAYMV